MSYHDEVIRDNPSAYWSFQDAPAGKGTRVNLCPDPSFEGSNAISQYWYLESGANLTLAKTTGTTNSLTLNQSQFTVDTSGWTVGDSYFTNALGTTLTRETTNPYVVGGAVGKVVGTGAATYEGPYISFSGLLPSTTYTIVAMVKTSGTGPGVSLNVRDATAAANYQSTVVSSSSWTEHRVTFTTSAATTQGMFSIAARTAVTETFYIANVGMWQGNGGSWTPAGQGSPLSYNGISSLSLTCSSAGSVQVSQKSGTLGEFNVVGGKSYAVSARALSTAANSTTKIGIVWKTATGSTSAALGSAVAINTSTWTTVSAVLVAPEDAIYGRVTITTTMATSEVIYFDAFLIEQGAAARGYFDGDTVDATWITDKSGISVFGVSRTNCLQDPRFTTINGATTWYQPPGYSYRQVATGGHDGGSYVESTVTNAGATCSYGQNGSIAIWMPVRAGEEVMCSVYVKNSVANNFYMYVFWYDKNGNYVGQPGFNFGVLPVVSEWHRQSGKFVAPYNAAYFRVSNFVYISPPTLGNVVSASGAMVESGDTLNEYFDGSYDDCSWKGSANLSYSTTSTVNDETYYNNTALANAGWSKFPQASEEYNSVKLTTGSEMVYTDYYPTNLLTDNESSMETSVVTTGTTNCTVSKSSTYAYNGTYSGKATSSAAGGMATGNLASVSVTAGEVYTISGYVMSDKPGGMGCQISLGYVNAYDAPISDGLRANANVNGWTRFERMVLVPAGTTALNIGISTSVAFGGEPTASGQSLYFDALCLSKSVSGRWKLPSATATAPADKLAFPVKALSGIADQKPFVFECLFKPDSYKSNVALLETYTRPDNISLLAQAGVINKTYITVPSDKGIFAGRVLTNGGSLYQGAQVTTWDNKSFTITNASYAGGTITYTAPGHTLVAGTGVAIFGINPTAYNVQGAVAAVSGDDFTITKTITVGSYVSGGSARQTLVNLTNANAGTVSTWITSTSVNGSGFYYSDGQIYFRAYGVDRFNNVVDSRVEYNLPDTNSHHLVFKVSGNLASIYVDGKLVASDKFTLPARYDNISGYRSKAYVGTGWLSNVALYNSAINIDEITAHYKEKVGTKDNLATYTGTSKQVFDITSKNNQSTDTLSSPSVTPWSGYDRTNVVLNERSNRMGLQTFNPLVPYNNTVTYTSDGVALKSNGLYFEDAQSVMAGDFAITANVRFNLYTQDADSYDGQRFCIFQVSSEDKSSTISAYRILQDVSGTKYTFLALGIKLTGQNEILEYIDYSPWGTSFSTSTFNIMLKRLGDTFTLVSYNTVTGSTGTATIVNSEATKIVGPLYVAMTNDNTTFGQFTINTLKIADTITDDATFMTSMLTQERCYAKLLTDLKVSQRGYATGSIVPSSTNSDGTTNTTVNDMRVLWEPEVSNITVSTKVNRNLLSINQASVETDTSGFSYGLSNPMVLTRSTTNSYYGQASLQVTQNSALGGLLTTSNFIPVSPNTEYTAVGRILRGTGTRENKLAIRWYTSAGAYITSSITSSILASNTSWTQYSVTGTSPANATQAYVAVEFASGTMASGDTFYLDTFGFWQGNDTFWALPYFPDGMNLLSPNQSSVETDTTGFQAINATLARSTAKSLTGSSSLAVTSTTSGTIQAYTPLSTSGVAIEPGRQYSATASMLAATTPRQSYVGIWWYDSVGGYIKADVGTFTTTLTGEWKNLTVNGLAPTNAVWAAVGAIFLGAAGAGEIHYVDRIALMPGANQQWSAPPTDNTVWQPISEPGSRPSWFINNASVPYKNDIRIDFTTNDSLDDVPELYSLNVAYDSLGAIEEIKSAEALTVSGQYTLAHSSLPVTAQAENGGYKQLGQSSISYQPDITRDNIIPNWSFTNYSGWDSNEDETIVVDKTLSSGVGMAIPMSSTASLFTSSDTKYNVVSSAQYTLCVYAKSTGDASAVATINWFDSTGTSVGSPASSSSTPLGTSVVPVTVTASAPATAKMATVSIAFTGTDDQTVTVDSAIMNEGAATITIDDNAPFVIFPQTHTYKTVAMVIRNDTEFAAANSTTLFDNYNGSTRYRIYMLAGGILAYSGFSRVYVNGSLHFNGNAIVSDGWTHIVATIDDGGSINPSSSRIASFLATTTSTEYGYWSADSLWFQRDVATQSSVTNDYQEIFGRINKKVYDVLSATTILGSEVYRTISTPWTKISSPQ